MTFPTNNKQSKDNKSSDPYDSSKHDTNSNNASIIFEVTENMSKIGLKEFVFNRNIFQFRFGGRDLCIVPFAHNKTTLSKLCKLIKDKLLKKLEYSEYLVDDPQTLEAALSDIENQIIEKRVKIFGISNRDTNYKKSNHVDDEFKLKFIEEAKELRRHFEQSSDPYKEWQIKVVEKYEILKNLFKKYYPDAWTFMEFCLSVKSVLNITDCTLPFMGVLIAPPSSTKTMVIELFRKYPHTFYSDSFTPSSLVSHNASLTEERLQEVDMLPKMKDNLMLTPELAALFTAKEDDLQKVMGIITRILDGHGLENDSGAQGHRRYGDTMFVWLGATVEIPYKVWKLLGNLGHKIYFIRPPLRKKTVKDLKRIAKSNNFSKRNKEIEQALLDYLKTFDAAPEVEGKIKLENGIVKIRWNEEIEEEQDKALEHISHLANLLASLRGTVYVSEAKSANRKFNYYQRSNDDDGDNPSQNHSQQQKQQQQPNQIEGQDYDTDFPIIEDPSRAVTLLRNLSIGHTVSQGRDYITLEDVPIAIKVALSTAPVRRVKLLDLLLKAENGELTTSQITYHLSISQPIATKTMREFAVLGLVDISTVSNYNNSELQIKLKPEFGWFRTEEFQSLKGDFVPSDVKKNGDEDDSNDVKQSSTDGRNGNNRDNNSGNNDISISPNKAVLPSEEYEQQKGSNTDKIDSCDKSKDCHTLEQNSPPEAQQKNDVLDNCINQSESPKEDYDLQSSLIQNQNENLEPQSSSSSNHPDDHDIEKNSTSLWGSKSLEHVTLSHSTQDSESPYQVSPTIRESDGIKYITFQEILKTIELTHGSTIAVNHAITTVCKNNETVRNYLGDKITSRENRNVRDLVSNVIRHPNIKIIKNKPQLLVKWFESNKDSSTISQKGKTA